MKNLKKVGIILSVLFFASCEKFEKHEEEPGTCPCVSNETVPDNVRSAFTRRYPQNSPEKWFNKDDQGFAAVFTQNSGRTLVEFNNDGSFRTENAIPPTGSTTQPEQPTKPPCKSAGKRHHPPRRLFGFMPPKHHRKCERPETDGGCHVELED